MGRWTRQFSWRHQIMAAALLLGFGSLISPSPAAAQEEIEEPLFKRLRWARFELVRGRLEVHDIRRGQNRSITVNHHELKVREHISFRVDNNELLLHYERQGPDESIILDVHGNKLLTLSRIPTSPDQQAVVFHQDRTQVRFQVGGEKGREYHAPHLWLMFIEHPDDCHQHLIPLLETLRQDWHLGRNVETVEANLLRAVHATPRIDITFLRQKIEELGSGPYRQRRAADIAIRSMGQGIIGILSEIDTHGMNAEQRLRIQRICESTIHHTADTPLSVTSWLKSSPSTWLCLMQHPDRTIRELAHRRMALLTDRPIPFHPDASPSIRERQIAQLRENLDMRR